MNVAASRYRLCLYALAFLSPFALRASGGEFALRDGDTVVFLGDSITAARTYTKIIENYTLLRFPERSIRYFNAGIGGDTASGALKRLERDVFSKKPTVVTVCFGLNDIGWGLRANDEHKTLYIESLKQIISECHARQIRVFICSGPITAEDPDKSEKGYLQSMCDEAFAMARQNKVEVIDVQRPMRDVQRRVLAANKTVADPAKHVKLHLADSVHLNDLGHLAMAYSFLKGWDAPSEVSRAAIDLKTNGASAQSGCRISTVHRTENGCEFHRQDDGLPFNGGLFYALNFLYVPFHRDFNGYWLTVQGLDAGDYDIVVDERLVARRTAIQLEAGVDLASSTGNAWQPGGPWDVQATLLRSLTDARHEIDTARLLSGFYLPGHPLTNELASESEPAEAKVIALQRQTARPRNYHFVIRRSAEKQDAESSRNNPIKSE